MSTNDLPPRVRNPSWFQVPVSYEGRARVEFIDPPGVVEGPAVVCIDESGAQLATIQVETPVQEGSSFFTKGEVRAEDFRRHGFGNPCKSVVVTTPQGEWSAAERVYLHGGNFRPERNQITLKALRSQFSTRDTATSSWWVLPLTNFVPGRWMHGWSGLADHPLRMIRPRPIPDDVNDEQRNQLKLENTFAERLIPFDIDRLRGYIEPLPEFDQIVGLMNSNKVRSAVTAVMVGPAHVSDVRYADYEGLFPLDVCAALTLATGAPVGSPWLEFRDADGRLIRRTHIPFGNPAYKQGYPALPDYAPQAIAVLLTRLFACEDRGQGFLRVVVTKLIDASRRSNTLETRFTDLVRAFETLCHHYGLREQNDLKALLDAAQKAIVKKTLDESADRFQRMARAEADVQRQAALTRIADRVRNAGGRDKNFGMSVGDLLSRFNLHDAGVVSRFLAEKPMLGATEWSSLLSRLRGCVMHEAYFDLSSGRHDLFALETVMDHLQDVLLRVVLKIVKYEGVYQSSIPPLGSHETLDWVGPNTAPGCLGYY